MPGEIPPPSEGKYTKEELKSAEMTVRYPVMLGYIRKRLIALSDMEFYLQGKRKELDEWKEGKDSTKQLSENVEFSLKRSLNEKLMVRDADKALEDGEVFPTAEILLKDLREFFRSVDSARKQGDVLRENELQKDFKPTLLAFQDLLKYYLNEKE